MGKIDTPQSPVGYTVYNALLQKKLSNVNCSMAAGYKFVELLHKAIPASTLQLTLLSFFGIKHYKRCILQVTVECLFSPFRHDA